MLNKTLPVTSHSLLFRGQSPLFREHHSRVPPWSPASLHVACLLLFLLKLFKVGLKLNIQKTKIIASGPITSWEIDGETVETVSDFILGAPKSLQTVTAAMKLKDAYSLEEKL